MCTVYRLTSGQKSFVEKSEQKIVKVEIVTTPVLAQHLTSPLYGPGQNSLEAQLQRRASYSGGGGGNSGGPPSQLQGLLMLPQQPQHNSESQMFQHQLPPQSQRQAPFGMPAAPAVSATSSASINRKRQLSGAPVIINTAAPASVAVVAAGGSGQPAVTTSSGSQQIVPTVRLPTHPHPRLPQQPQHQPVIGGQSLLQKLLSDK